MTHRTRDPTLRQGRGPGESLRGNIVRSPIELPPDSVPEAVPPS